MKGDDIQMNVYDIKRELSNIDLKVLYNIYMYRCLSLNQIYTNFYANKYKFNEYIDTVINKLKKFNLIEEVLFNSSSVALFLTKTGIDIIKEVFDLDTNIIDTNKNIIKRGYYRAYELKMLPRLIPHQIYLNQFALDFANLYNHANLKQAWNYYDEKYVSQYNVIRPDGLIRIKDMDFFLELDMASESVAQLEEKWTHYRKFLNSREFLENDRKILVFFILENTNNPEKRKQIIKKTANGISDLIKNNFDIYIGTREELLRKIFLEIIPNEEFNNKQLEILRTILKAKNFKVDKAYSLKKALNDTEYMYYMRMLDENNNIVIKNNKVQEFLIDYYDGSSMSIFNKWIYFNKNNAYFNNVYKRDIRLIIICNNISNLKADKTLLNIYNDENIYFTTLEDLKNKEHLHEALYQIDNMNNLFSFFNENLNTRDYKE